MPVEVDELRKHGGAPVRLRPETNAFRIVEFLVRTPELAYSPKEISEATDVPRSSVGKTLQRLEDRGLVQHLGEYWAVADDDRLASHVASIHSMETVADRYGDDYYGENPDWADDLPDLGENA